MKGKIRRALKHELRDVHVSEDLKIRILSNATRGTISKPARRTFPVAYATAAVVVVCVLAASLLSINNVWLDINSNPLTSNGAGKNNAKAEIVWTTTNGLYYHSDENCSGMEGAIEMTVGAAEAEGKKPCQMCMVETSASKEIVWATTNGLYYHGDENCSGMEGATEMTVGAAEAKGKEPCPMCMDLIAPEPTLQMMALPTEEMPELSFDGGVEGTPLPNDLSEVVEVYATESMESPLPTSTPIPEVYATEAIQPPSLTPTPAPEVYATESIELPSPTLTPEPADAMETEDTFNEGQIPLPTLTPEPVGAMGTEEVFMGSSAVLTNEAASLYTYDLAMDLKAYKTDNGNILLLEYSYGHNTGSQEWPGEGDEVAPISTWHENLADYADTAIVASQSDLAVTVIPSQTMNISSELCYFYGADDSSMRAVLCEMENWQNAESVEMSIGMDAISNTQLEGILDMKAHQPIVSVNVEVGDGNTCRVVVGEDMEVLGANSAYAIVDVPVNEMEKRGEMHVLHTNNRWTIPLAIGLISLQDKQILIIEFDADDEETRKALAENTSMCILNGEEDNIIAEEIKPYMYLEDMSDRGVVGWIFDGEGQIPLSDDVFLKISMGDGEAEAEYLSWLGLYESMIAESEINNDIVLDEDIRG